MFDLYESDDIEKKLADLLEELFMQDDEDIVVLRKPGFPIIDGNCCSGSYGGYSY